MHKADYELIAATFKKVRSEEGNLMEISGEKLMYILLYELSSAFKDDNPRFDKVKFVDAVYNHD